MTETVVQSGFQFWAVGLLAFLLGLLVGAGVLFALGRAGLLHGGRSALQQARDEHDRYRSSVDAHFHKTAELFDTLSDHYQGLYRHMAEGAEALCEPGDAERSLGFSTPNPATETISDPLATIREPAAPLVATNQDQLYRQSEGAN